MLKEYEKKCIKLALGQMNVTALRRVIKTPDEEILLDGSICDRRGSVRC